MGLMYGIKRKRIATRASFSFLFCPISRRTYIDGGDMQREQPLTPIGRLLAQPLTDQIIYCAISVESPFDVEVLKAGVRRWISFKPPRFCSLLVRDSRGRESWQRTTVDVDRHLLVHHHRLSDDPTVCDEDAVNDFIADMSVSSPLPTDKPLWEIHLLLAHRTAVFRVHHLLGDGVSLMSMLLSFCRRSDDPAQLPSIGGAGSATETAPSRRRRVSTLLMVIWYTLVHVLELCLRVLWLRDKTTAVSGGAGVEFWPRKLATARFRLDDMKAVKRAVPHATINDVLIGIISSGLSRYSDIVSPKDILEGLQITCLSMKNLRPQTGLQDILELINTNSGMGWGNKFSMNLLPIYYHRNELSNPIQFVKRAKASMDKKKLSFEALFLYKIGSLIMSFLGAKAASALLYKIICSTTFMVSNIVGPTEKITLMSNPVKNVRVTSSSFPHAITMHMVSYEEMANLQILVAKEVVPDPKVLAKCFEDALLDMREAAEAADGL